MSDIGNPYQSPENVSVPEKPLVSQAVLTETMLKYLKVAAPWLRFVGILSFIACGLMLVGGIIATVFMSALSGVFEDLGGIPAGVFGLIYIVSAVVMFFPARFIYNFGARIRNYLLSNSEEELEQAFKNNKSLWKFYGIMCIVSLAFIPLGLIGAIVVAVSSAF